MGLHLGHPHGPIHSSSPAWPPLTSELVTPAVKCSFILLNMTLYILFDRALNSSSVSSHFQPLPILRLQQEPTSDHNFIMITCIYRTCQFFSVSSLPLVYLILPIFQEAWLYCPSYKGDQPANRGQWQDFNLGLGLNLNLPFPSIPWTTPKPLETAPIRADPTRGDLRPDCKAHGLLWRKDSTWNPCFTSVYNLLKKTIVVFNPKTADSHLHLTCVELIY